MPSFELQLKRQDQMNQITFEQGRNIEKVYDIKIPELDCIQNSLVPLLSNPLAHGNLDTAIESINTALNNISKRETYKPDDIAQTRVLMSHYSLLTNALIRTKDYLFRIKLNDTTTSGW